MTTLADIFDDLETGELSQYSFSGELDAVTGVQQKDYPALIRHINRGLLALHTRFCLKEREVAVNLDPIIAFYILDSKYAQSNADSTEPVKYIMDTVDNPFTDDIIRIQEVYDEDGSKLPVNDNNNDMSVFLPNYKTMQVPFPAANTTLFITYRAKHATIDDEVVDTSLVQIEIPDYCIEPLLSYVTSRVYSSSADQNKQALSASFMAKYEMQCKSLEDYNVLHNTPNETNIKLDEGGWV